MDFKEATDRLMGEGFTAADIAAALDLAPQTVRAMRLDPDSPHYRRPPDEWQARLAELVTRRGTGLRELAEALRREAGE